MNSFFGVHFFCIWIIIDKNCKLKLSLKFNFRKRGELFDERKHNFYFEQLLQM